VTETIIRYRTPPATRAEDARRVRFEQFMQTYWTQLQAWIAAAEYETCTTPFAGRSEELDHYRQAHPPMLFRDYLIASRGCPR